MSSATANKIPINPPSNIITPDSSCLQGNSVEAEVMTSSQDGDEDMDALIDELESEDDRMEDHEDDNEVELGNRFVVPEDQLQTDCRVGLTEFEVQIRRKKYGMNQMKEEKENLILKFLGYFFGPIQFVMEVCC